MAKTVAIKHEVNKIDGEEKTARKGDFAEIHSIVDVPLFGTLTDAELVESVGMNADWLRRGSDQT
jgi:hypothetical protein